MISTRAIEIIPLLEEPFNYEEYKAKCKAMDFDVLPEGIYAQKLGMFMAGVMKYPQLEPTKAYIKFIGDINTTSKRVRPNPKAKGCCGGNKTK